MEFITPKSDLPGKPHGKGQMFYADSGDAYDGDWQHGKKHGIGCQHYASGDSTLKFDTVSFFFLFFHVDEVKKRLRKPHLFL